MCMCMCHQVYSSCWKYVMPACHDVPWLPAETKCHLHSFEAELSKHTHPEAVMRVEGWSMIVVSTRISFSSLPPKFVNKGKNRIKLYSSGFFASFCFCFFVSFVWIVPTFGLFMELSTLSTFILVGTTIRSRPSTRIDRPTLKERRKMMVVQTDGVVHST